MGLMELMNVSYLFDGWLYVLIDPFYPLRIVWFAFYYLGRQYDAVKYVGWFKNHFLNIFQWNYIKIEMATLIIIWSNGLGYYICIYITSTSWLKILRPTCMSFRRCACWGSLCHLFQEMCNDAQSSAGFKPGKKHKRSEDARGDAVHPLKHLLTWMEI